VWCLFVQTPTNISSKSLEILFVQYLRINIHRTRNTEGFGRSNMQILYDIDSSKSCAFVWGEDVCMRRERLSKSTSPLNDLLYTCITCITLLLPNPFNFSYLFFTYSFHIFKNSTLWFLSLQIHLLCSFSSLCKYDFASNCSSKSPCLFPAIPSANTIVFLLPSNFVVQFPLQIWLSNALYHISSFNSLWILWWEGDVSRSNKSTTNYSEVL